MDHPTEQFLEREELSRVISGPDPPAAVRQRLDELEQLYGQSVGWDNPRNSPHVWLQLVGGVEQNFRGYYASRSQALDLQLRPEHPRREWRSRKGELRTAAQWGQRKLLMVEVEFLTRYGHLSDTVVYAGSARGDHIATLAWMFPHTFHLYDPSPAWYTPSERLVVYEQLFLRADAERYSGQCVLFISDVVTTDIGFAYEENRVRQRRDMAWQMGWVESMKPAMAVLRFALPWGEGTSEYLDGELWLQPWTQPTSTETRLVTDGRTRRAYDHREYEEQLAYHNAVTRLSLHDYRLGRAVEGMDHCRDCALDVAILTRYVAKHGYPGDARASSSVAERVAALLIVVAQRLGNILTEVMDRAKTIERVREGQLVAGALAFEAPLQIAIASGLEYQF